MKLLRLQMLACLLSDKLTWLQYGETEKTICRGVAWVSNTAGLLIFFFFFGGGGGVAAVK
jgi:hypothetical protein